MLYGPVMKQTAVRMEESMAAQAKARAAEQSRTFGSYLRNLIAIDLKKSGEADFNTAKKDVMNGRNEMRKGAKKKK